MLNALPFNKFPDGVTRPGKKLSRCIKNSFVEMEKSMLNIVPQKMEVNVMGVSRLSAVAAVMSMKMLLTVSTGNGGIFHFWYFTFRA
jgi:hypothetical protein